MILDSFNDESNGNEFMEVPNKNGEDFLKTISSECETPDPNFFECPVVYMNKFSLLVDSNVVIAKKQPDQKNILMYQSK